MIEHDDTSKADNLNSTTSDIEAFGVIENDILDKLADILVQSFLYEYKQSKNSNSGDLL
jgi:hypothetical protein